MAFEDLRILEIRDVNVIELEAIEEVELQEEEEVIIRVPKRYIRDAQNPFELYNEMEFKRRFRFSKESVMFGILPLVEEGLAKPNNRGLPIAPVLQLLICLRFYSTASFQLIVGDVLQISQSTISRIVYRVSTLLASHINHYIKMPESDEARSENKHLFQQLGYGPGAIGLPCVDGAIDCTHVRLVHTRFQDIEEISLNVQVIVGPRTEIMDIVPEWPGSEHDSRIFQNSRIYMRYRQNELDGMLVGDSGYPALPYLLTPIKNPTTEEEISYNAIHGRTRRIVERTFGIWKRRFPCLARGLTTKLLTSTSIIVACGVLYNLSLILNDRLDIEEEEEQHADRNDEVPEMQPHWQPGDGFLVRNALIERLFR